MSPPKYFARLRAVLILIGFYRATFIPRQITLKSRDFPAQDALSPDEKGTMKYE
jgi:hypothetical protein